ncbi:SDR family oxidoreductase [Roseivirga sp. BDSF3-8]|uniref:SDR family oxidoreductase n=1 Tax=Roseivirga sp. BDSF3-8 TaxID=3241598 RepID=UPI0035327093
MADRVIIVTAASRGMGAEIARKLHAEGYKLALMSRSEDLEVVAKETGALIYFGSTTEKSDIEGLVSITIEKYGRIDGIVCNTGHPPKGELLQLTIDQWQEGFDIALFHLIHLVKVATPYLEKSRGAVVSISAFGAVEPSLDFPVSSVVRAALGAFSKLYADKYGEKGIRINNVLPGFIDTFDVSDERLNLIPLHRAGKKTEIADTVAFLLSDSAGYITGQNIRVDGGLTRSL